MISLYRPGDSILHRVSAGWKLLGLATSALAISIARPGTTCTLVLLGAASLVLLAAGAKVPDLLLVWWRLRWLIIVLGGALVVFVSVAAAVQNTGRVVALLLLAEALTRTTKTSDLLDVLRTLFRPLRVFGIDPGTPALAVSLTIAMVPVLAGLLEQVRDAQRARGVRLAARAAVPLLVLAMKHADDVGDALTARGLGR
ncbi:energy-coupling factor transporter transmembrane component T family protein [Microbacterium sp. nov. GSS16]|uniref:energy-coupling factor transporter transmembrane component T family protein n=1 Tax=Microbacterium sp. nov. GSS16 TaxID=3019890 RepID=UPI002305D858|nr:energy-coupling factor transporter transmembrane protein EcfT [Microbacterium sp. nov. GSS16]WCD92008.1 energy-coupling factor transporter transmembrane protein EcfT [Microbacterium sp. nov. GSS16]